MDYEQMLKLVKVQNPKLPYREQQQLASKKFKEYKAAQEAHASNDVSFAKGDEGTTGAAPSGAKTENQAENPAENQPQAKPAPKRVSIGELSSAEKRIREAGVNRNTIISIGREVIPEGELVKHGRDGVNSLVTFEDKLNNKLPVYGFFKIFMAG